MDINNYRIFKNYLNKEQKKCNMFEKRKFPSEKLVYLEIAILVLIIATLAIMYLADEGSNE